MRSVRNFTLMLTSLIISIGAIGAIFWEKGTFLKTLNQLHTPFTDFFFKYITYLGDGLIILIASIGLYFYKKSIALICLLSYFLSGALAQILKRTFQYNRPSKALEDFNLLVLVPGEQLSRTLSFPSGHTTSAFAFFLALFWFSEKKHWPILGILIALLVGVSRVYLLQHFLMDITAGAFLGSLCVPLSHLILKKSGKLDSKQ